MQPLIIKKTSLTPEIILDNTKGIFQISGKSLPEDALGFYQPVHDWFETYVKTPNPSTHLVFELEYFNSASAKTFISILYLLNNLTNGGLDVEVDWRYTEDDEDTLDTGQDFAALVNIPFTFSILST